VALGARNGQFHAGARGPFTRSPGRGTCSDHLFDCFGWSRGTCSPGTGSSRELRRGTGGGQFYSVGGKNDSEPTGRADSTTMELRASLLSGHCSSGWSFSTAANHGSTDRKQGTKPAPKRVRPGPRPPEASSQRRKSTGDRCKETSGGRARLQSGARSSGPAPPVGSEAKASHRRSA
jgi:hypothetical protein